jgi:hypothetical protein
MAINDRGLSIRVHCSKTPLASYGRPNPLICLSLLRLHPKFTLGFLHICLGRQDPACWGGPSHIVPKSHNHPNQSSLQSDKLGYLVLHLSQRSKPIPLSLSLSLSLFLTRALAMCHALTHMQTRRHTHTHTHTHKHRQPDLTLPASMSFSPGCGIHPLRPACMVLLSNI